MLGTLWTIPIVLCLISAETDGQTPPRDAAVAKARECLGKALDAAQRVEDVAKKRRVLEDIGGDLADLGEFDAARQAIQMADDPKATAMILAAIGRTQAKRGDRDGGKATLAEAMKRSNEVPSDGQRFVLYTILEGHLAAEQLDEAMRIASRFRSQFDRSLAQMRVAEAHLAAGRREVAREILRQIPLPAPDTWRDFETSQIVEQLGPLYLALRDVDAALKIARAIPRGYWVRCHALCEVGTYQLKRGDASAASAILQEALEAARGTEPQGDGISVDVAHEAEMARVVRAHVDGGDHDGAVRVLRQMSNGYQKVEAFRAIAAAQAKARNEAAARATLKQAVDMIVGLSDDDSLKVESLALLAMCQVEIGECAAARDTVAKAMPWLARCDSDVVLPAHSIAEVQVRLDDRLSAKKTLDDAARKILATSDAEFRVWDGTTMASAQIDLGFNREALTTLRSLAVPLAASTKKGEEEEENEEEEDPYSSGRDNVAVLLARAGDLARGYQLAREIETEPDFTVRQVAAHYVVVNGSEKALALAEKETDPAMRCELYHGIAMGLLHLAKVETSTSWLIGSDWLLW